MSRHREPRRARPWLATTADPCPVLPSFNVRRSLFQEIPSPARDAPSVAPSRGQAHRDRVSGRAGAYFVAQLTTAAALASSHCAPIIPSMWKPGLPLAQ